MRCLSANSPVRADCSHCEQSAVSRQPVLHCNITGDTFWFTQQLKKNVNKQNRTDSV
jgi:hypothetical protein